jgi:hypothetical protein
VSWEETLLRIPVWIVEMELFGDQNKMRSGRKARNERKNGRDLSSVAR